MLRALEGSYGVAGQGGAGSKFVKHCFSIGVRPVAGNMAVVDAIACVTVRVFPRAVKGRVNSKSWWQTVLRH